MQKFDTHLFLDLYRYMLTSRKADSVQSDAAQRGEAFFYIPASGHEAMAALAPHLTEADWLHCHYRDRALLLARGILSWADYAETLLRLPAKTVIVLTMACHSGGLTDWLKSDEEAQGLLKKRREDGHNFLVLTSQKAGAFSNPRRIEGRIINPFTYAVMKALEGAADGYRSGKPTEQPDGEITLGELSDFILNETAKHTRDPDAENDPIPQSAGSFEPQSVLIRLFSE